MNGRRAAWPVYALGAAIVFFMASFAYTYWTNRQHDGDLARLSLQRQADSNRFFEEVCDRFAIRDEIVLRVLQEAYGRALVRGDRVYAESLLTPIVALREAQGECEPSIPDIRKPPSPP